MATPFIQQILWLLIAQCAIILFLCLPFHVPYRRTTVEWLARANGPVMHKIKSGIAIAQGVIFLLWVDNVRRLMNLDTEVELIKDTDSFATGQTLFTLYSRRGRAQRDNYIMMFELYSSCVIFFLHLTILRMGRYRNERNEYKAKYEKLANDQNTGTTSKAAGKSTSAKITSADNEAVQRK